MSLPKLSTHVLTTCRPLVGEQVRVQLAVLETRQIATEALKNGYCVVVDSVDEMVEIADRLAAEHLEVHMERSAVGLLRVVALRFVSALLAQHPVSTWGPIVHPLIAAFNQSFVCEVLRGGLILSNRGRSII